MPAGLRWPLLANGLVNFGLLIPKPLDLRIISWEVPTVAEAAMDEGVAWTTVDLAEYANRLVVRRTHCVRACRLVCEVPT